MQLQWLLQQPPFNPSQPSVAQIQCGPVPPRKSPDGPQSIDECITTACTRTEAAGCFGVRTRAATRAERTSFAWLSLISARTSTPAYPDVILSREPYPPPVVHTPMPLTAPQYTPVGASAPGEMVPPHPSLGHPSLPPVGGSSAHPSLHQPNPPFDDRAIPPPQGIHHPNIRVAPSIPTKAEATTTPPIREVIMHSNPSTPPPPAHYHHHPSLPPKLNSSHPHSLTIEAKDSSPANASATTNIIDPDDDKLYCFCGNINFGEMIGCDGPECETEWFHFACVGIDPKAKPEGSWFCESCRLGKDSSIGKKVGGGGAKGGGSNRGGGRGGKKSAGGGARRGGRV
jgi:uncharacterized membrane protein YgcG